MNLKEAYDFGVQILKDAQIISADIDARVLLCYVTDLTQEQIFLRGNEHLEYELFLNYCNSLTRRVKREPVSHIVGKKGFWKYEFSVDKNVLDPRPCSELFIEAVLEYFEQEKFLEFLELGVGSGALSISILKEFPNSNCVATDISMKAIKVARKNAENLDVLNRIEFKNCNWCDGINKEFDLIISNPPYISKKDFESLEPEVTLYDPMTALVAENNGLACYYEIAKLSNKLKENGMLLLEVGYDQAEKVKEIFENNGFKFIAFKKDLENFDRLVIFKKG